MSSFWNDLTQIWEQFIESSDFPGSQNPAPNLPPNLGNQSPRPSPSPSPGGSPSGGTNLAGTPFGGNTSLSNPPKSPETGTSTGAPPPAFVNAVVAKLQQMIGPRYYLIDTSILAGIAQKLWNNVSLQQTWNAYSANPQAFASAFDTQIQATVLNANQDPSIDPTIISDYIDAKQSAGESLTTAELTALSQSTQAANAAVPRPFSNYAVSGWKFGDPRVDPKTGQSRWDAATGWDYHQGTDFGTKVGDRIVSPFAGTAHVQLGIPYYGNKVTIRLDNGWTISFGHVGSSSISDGARVNPGDLIAIAGSNVGDSTGAVTLVEVRNPQGQAIDPAIVLNPIFKGTTFAQLPDLGAGSAGTGYPTVNATLDREYPDLKTYFNKYVGRAPSPEDVYDILSHGTSPKQWEDYIRSWPSHIDGLNIGQAVDLRDLADTTSTKYLGHPATDGVVKDLYDQGLTDQQDVNYWYEMHSPNEIDKQTYNQIYQAVQPILSSIYNEPTGADPRDIQAIHDRQAKRQGAGGNE